MAAHDNKTPAARHNLQVGAVLILAGHPQMLFYRRLLPGPALLAVCSLQANI